jgi:hypothetical protein
MQNGSRWVAVGLLAACLQLAACKHAEPDADEAKSATVEHLTGAEPARVTLTEDAVERLQIQTAAVTTMDLGGTQRTVIPYAAVLYDTEGDTWTYMNPDPLVFVRHAIVVDRIEGDLAYLSEGPAVGGSVVTVGAAELYGSEIEFEEE